MKNITTHNGKLEVIMRLPSSNNGNPRFLIRINGVTCSTEVDSMLAFCISNYEGKDVTASIGTHYGTTTLHNIESANA